MTYSRSCRLALTFFFVVGSAFSQPAASYISRTVAGVFPIGDNGPATSALLESPQAVAVDASGVMYVADSGNGAIRKVSRNGVISSVVGYSGTVYDLKLDAAGSVYICDSNNHKIRKVGTH